MSAARFPGANLAPRLKTLENKRLGLLSTGKRNCDLLVAEIGDLLPAVVEKLVRQ